MAILSHSRSTGWQPEARPPPAFTPVLGVSYKEGAFMVHTTDPLTATGLAPELLTGRHGFFCYPGRSTLRSNCATS
jgi:hypothetical protein